MGALYLAVAGEKGLEKLCVVKTALPHLLGKGYGQRFRDEASVVVRLSHGNLVNVFDAGQVAGEIFIAMDFVDGKDLRAVWNRCAQKGVAFPIDIAVHIAKEMSRGLGYVHAFKGLRLVHRDISPPNVLISYTGEVKITDFGLAWSTLKLEKTAPGIIFGKVSYMAPEQARGETLDGRADIYACGIILWELLTGRQLFPAPPGSGTDDEALAKVRQPNVLPPSQRAARVPRELDEIVMKALDPNPARRHQSGEALRADLAAFQARLAPATDGDHVANFLKSLFGDVIGNERHEREELVQDAASLLSIPTAPLSRDELLPVAKGARSNKPGDRPPGARDKDGSQSKPAEHTSNFSGESTTTGSPRLPAKPPPPPPPSASASTALSGADAPSQLIGTLLAGRYRIKKLCGEGGMGRVYEAEHVEIGRRVAVKVLHPAYSRTPEVVERFRREARAASKVGHPNIVDVTDSGTTDDGSFFFVMEFIEGVELGLVIFKEGPMPVQRSLHIGAQMCDALQAAHDAGIIHRDLKPENVLLITKEGQPDFVKVLDFGIAKSADVEETAKNNRKLTRPGVAMGTPEYMAPEQAAGKPADPRSDIYAVGSIIYEMLTATAPYDGDNVMEVLHKKANHAPTPVRSLRPDLSGPVEALVERAMARQPQSRPQSMGELASELRTLSSALGDDLPPPPPARTPAAQRRDSPLLAGTVAGSGPSATMWGLSRRTLAAGAGALVLVAGLVVIRAITRPAPGARATMTPTLSGPVRPAPVAPTQLTAAPAPVLYGPTEAPVADETEEPARRPPGKLPRKGHAAPERQKLLKEGWGLYQAQRFEEARGTFNKLMSDRRAIGSASLGLAKVAFQEHRYDEAARWAKQSARYGGGVEAAVLLGDAHYRLQQLPEARTAYREALKRDPTNEAAQRMLQLVDRKLQ